MKHQHRKNSSVPPVQPKPSPKPQAPSLPSKVSVSTTKEVVNHYGTLLTALGALVPTLPNIAVLVTTVEERRRAEIRRVVDEAVQLSAKEQTERRVIQRLPLSKRAKAEVSKLTRKGAELSKRVASLSERAEELFADGKRIPENPSLLDAHEEKDLFKALRQHRERFWTALHMVPFVREQVIQELREAREGGLKISQVVTSPRSKGKTEAQLARHVDTNVATSAGMLEREHGRPGLLNSAKIATLLVETPLAADKLIGMMNEVVSRSETLRTVQSHLVTHYGALTTPNAHKDPEHPLYLQLTKDFGGTLQHAEMQCRTLKALQEPYQRIKDYIVNANLRLVGKIACSRERNPERQEELKQDGVLGLMRAIEKFDVDTGLKLSTVATWWIRQMVLRKRPLYYHPIALPPHRVDVFIKVSAADAEATKSSDAQLSKQLKVDNEVIQAMRLQARPVLSLSARDQQDRSLAEIIPGRREEATIDAASQIELREKIEAMLRRIQPRLADILRKRFGLQGAPMTLDQVARQMGITRERVRQLEAKALNKIRSGPLAKMLEDFA